MQPRTLRVSAAPTPAGRASQKEPLAPYYASRALAAYPARTPLAGLTAGYAELARTLPVGSAAASLALRRLAARAGELLAGGRALPNPSREPAARAAPALGAPGHGGAQGGGQGGSARAAGPGRAQGVEQAEVAAGLGLVRLLAQLLLLVDLQVSPRMPAGSPPIPRPPVLGVACRMMRAACGQASKRAACGAQRPPSLLGMSTRADCAATPATELHARRALPVADAHW